MQSPDPNLDAQLRAVPLPAGLVERLRQIALADDQDFDLALREVRVPAGLLDRLRSLPWADDPSLDEALREISVPARLTDRLRSLPVADDPSLDEALRDVPVPAGLSAPWQRRLQRRNRLMLWSQLAVAASLLFVVCGLYFGSKIAGLVATQWAHVQPKSAGGPPIPVVVPASRPAVTADLTTSFASEEPAAAKPAVSITVPEIRLSQGEGGETAEQLAARDNFSVPPDTDPLQDYMLYHWGRSTLGGTDWGGLPEPRKAVGPVRRGMDWPLGAAANSPFFFKHHVHPFVAPAADPRLQSLVVPLAVDGASYELTRRYLEDKELPPPELVRTEEFLAAMDYAFPPPPSQQALGLSLAAGPSPFGTPGLCLLQVGVQARQVAEQPHPPVHLVLAVDVSGALRWGGRVDMVRRALEQFGRRMDAADRLSLIAFNEDARLLIQDVGPADADALAAAARSLAAEGSAEVSAGLSKAYLVAQQASVGNHSTVRVALLTNGLMDMAPESAQRIEQRLTEAAGQGISLHIIDLSRERQADPQLLRFAAAGHGAVHRAANADEIRWALREIVGGQSQVVARDALLRVSFNPKAVLEYRLLGHEATALAGLLPEHPQADFHDGQAATALYELRLAPGASGEVARAELTWYEGSATQPPSGREQRHAVGKIEPKQFAATFAQSAPTLQQAALAAEVAEALRKSFFVHAKTAAALNNVWQLSGHVDSSLAQRPAFRDFVALVQQAIGAKPAPPQGGKKRPAY